MKDVRPDDINHFIEFATSVQNVVAAMTSTEETGHMTNPMLIKEVIGKLPSILKYQWSFHAYEAHLKPVTLTHVSEWLIKAANAMTHVASMTTKPIGQISNMTGNRQPNTRPWRQENTVLATKNKQVEKCMICETRDHILQDCPEFRRMETDERWKYVTRQNLCFSCLTSQHRLRECRKKRKCSQCERMHNSLLHSEPRSNESQNAAYVNHQMTDDVHVLMKVARVVISGPTGSVETLALFDEGADVSLMDPKLAAEIGATGPATDLRMHGATPDMKTLSIQSQSVSFSIRGKQCTNIYKIDNVRVVHNLSLPVYKCSYKELCKYEHLIEYINVDMMTNERPRLLIGHDNIDLIVTRHVIDGPRNAPIVSVTRLGNIIHGKLSTLVPINSTVMHVCACEELNDAIKKTYSTEAFGTKPYFDSPRSREDVKALEIMERTTKMVGNRWETGLLWRQDCPKLPDSYGVARQRFDSLAQKMKRMPDFASRYSEKMVENEHKGYISRLTTEEKTTKTDKTWYLPHFAVFNPNKPNKVRIVLDCAAKSMGKSINDFLMSGPDLLTSLPGVLIGFRFGKIAVIGDIQEMFHRVLIRDEDRQAQRLLWNGDEYVMNVMTFGAICSPSSAQYVKNVNAKRFQSTHPQAVKAIVEHHYVDDFIYSVDSDDEAKAIVDDVIFIHSAGGFNMRNFMSNSKSLLQHLPSDKLAPAGLKMLTDVKGELTMTAERVLGVNWDPETDSFNYLLKLDKVRDSVKSGMKRPTKRDVLKLIMTVFDPLGFLLFITVRARLLFQDIWKSRIGWDDEIEASHFDRWQLWLDELFKARDVQISRWMFSNDFDKTGAVELHIFCDASSKAFASVAYLRWQSLDGSWQVSLVMAKARVAPLKSLSIPRLELQAALLGARLGQFLKGFMAVPLTRLCYWSDSKTVLAWITSESGRFKPFVAHRVSEIAELTDVYNWRWVPSGSNVADDAIRDTTVVDKNRWLRGPDFLYEPETQWTLEDESEPVLDPDDVEVKAVYFVSLESLGDALPDDKRFSNYWRLIRATAWSQRFLNNAGLARVKQSGELTAPELTNAGVLWLKLSQNRWFSSDIKELTKHKCVQKDSTIRQLTPFLDTDGIMRVGGRIELADVHDDTKHPIILHPNDHFTRLLINRYHREAAHNGRELVLNNLRKRYWVLNGRNAVKSVWNDCQICKNRRAQPQPPLMGQLPEVRLTHRNRAFTFTGLDYFGPMTVKVGRRVEKRYGALFTCLTVRAIHIELVNDLSTSSAIMALRRFVARRGCPREIWSDNATTFRGADNELKQSMTQIDRQELVKFGSIRLIKWNFIAPTAAHMGGCWERLIRSVKTSLKVTLKDRTPTDQTLLTVLVEAEFMINSRPLTYVPLDHADDLPLTPMDFLLTATEFKDYPLDFYSNHDLLRRNWRESQRLVDLLWRRWVHEYLPTLTRRDKWFRQTQPLTIGDLVIIADSRSPRNLWLRGVVTQVYPGRDGHVRVADVRTGQGQTGATYRRPVTKLCRLDVRSPF